MHSSIEARSPLLSDYIFEGVWKLKENFKVNGAQGKLILRSVSNDLFPKNFLNRPKIGFGIPISDYIRGPLKSWAEDLIMSDSFKNDEYFDCDIIKNIWYQHISNKVDRGFFLWNILNYVSWKKENFC